MISLYYYRKSSKNNPRKPVFWIASFLAITCKHVCITYVAGTPKTNREGRAGHGQNAGQRSQRTSKGLTLTERRLSFDYVECKHLPSQKALRDLRVRSLDGCGETDYVGLDFFGPFCIKAKGTNKKNSLSLHPKRATQ